MYIEHTFRYSDFGANDWAWLQVEFNIVSAVVVAVVVYKARCVKNTKIHPGNFRPGLIKKNT